MESENKYKEFSSDKVKSHKEKWDKDYFSGVQIVDCAEIIFLIIGVFAFFRLPRGFKVLFIVVLILFYWFRVKYVEKKIIEAKRFLILGNKFINEDFKGRGVTEAGAKPHYDSHKRGFDDYISFLEVQRNHLVARMIILNLFALVLLEIIRRT